MGWVYCLKQSQAESEERFTDRPEARSKKKKKRASNSNPKRKERGRKFGNQEEFCRLFFLYLAVPANRQLSLESCGQPAPAGGRGILRLTHILHHLHWRKTNCSISTSTSDKQNSLPRRIPAFQPSNALPCLVRWPPVSKAPCRRPTAQEYTMVTQTHEAHRRAYFIVAQGLNV